MKRFLWLLLSCWFVLDLNAQIVFEKENVMSLSEKANDRIHDVLNLKDSIYYEFDIQIYEGYITSFHEYIDVGPYIDGKTYENRNEAILLR